MGSLLFLCSFHPCFSYAFPQSVCTSSMFYFEKLKLTQIQHGEGFGPSKVKYGF